MKELTLTFPNLHKFWQIILNYYQTLQDFLNSANLDVNLYDVSDYENELDYEE